MSATDDYDRASNALRQARSIATLMSNLDSGTECMTAVKTAAELIEELIDSRSALLGAKVRTDDVSMRMYRAYVASHISDLRGKHLACWCALDAPCHADALLELANR